MIKHFLRWVRRSLRNWKSLHKKNGLLGTRRRLPRRIRLPHQTIRDLQALSAYRISPHAPFSKKEAHLARLHQERQSLGHQRMPKRGDWVTYSVPREEAIESLNRALEQERSTEGEDWEGDDRQRDSQRGQYRPEPGIDLPDLSIDPLDLAYLAECQGRYKEAERIYLRSLQQQRQAWGDAHIEAAKVMAELADLYVLQNRLAEAEALLTEAVAIQTQQEPTALKTGNSLYQLAKIYRGQSRYSDADPLFQTAIEIFRQQLGHGHVKTLRVYEDLMEMVMTAIESGKFSELNAGVPPLELGTLGETYSWARPNWAP
ncbi:MAG: tetratricopeptide repeat protein [Cyanobacteria bacterium J06573_11]